MKFFRCFMSAMARRLRSSSLIGRKKNAINLQMAELIRTYLRQADNDDSVRAIVLVGQPAVFSAGMDINAFHQGELPIVSRRVWRADPCTDCQVSSPAVDGIAYGGGFELALACDLIVAGQNARFSFPETGPG